MYDLSDMIRKDRNCHGICFGNVKCRSKARRLDIRFQATDHGILIAEGALLNLI
jgi:hypothetical protein